MTNIESFNFKLDYIIGKFMKEENLEEALAFLYLKAYCLNRDKTKSLEIVKTSLTNDQISKHQIIANNTIDKAVDIIKERADFYLNMTGGIEGFEQYISNPSNNINLVSGNTTQH